MKRKGRRKKINLDNNHDNLTSDVEIHDFPPSPLKEDRVDDQGSVNQEDQFYNDQSSDDHLKNEKIRKLDKNRTKKSYDRSNN